MIKVLLALILLGFLLALVGALAIAEHRRDIRRNKLRMIQRNPDAAWLYSQGLTPDEIELAVAQARRIV